ncbi:MAG: hypothetical protein GY867_04675 [bacterium]|nr:hypothetical protein [bacterium]
MKMIVHSRKVLVLLLAAALVASCAGRYHRSLYLVQEEEQKKVKVEKTEFVIDGVLGSPLTEEKIVSGPGNCVILTTGSRGAVSAGSRSDLVNYDQYLRYRIYLQLPSRLRLGRLPLQNNSFLQLLGHYELPPEDKMFIARSGEFSVDSLTDKHLFGSIDGSFQNDLQESVTFRGGFKVKIAR